MSDTYKTGDGIQINSTAKARILKVRKSKADGKVKSYWVELVNSGKKLLIEPGKIIKKIDIEKAEENDIEPLVEDLSYLPEEHRSFFTDEKRLPACRKCNNGNLYNPLSMSIYKDGLGKFIRTTAYKNYKHIILVPNKMELGKVSMRDRKECNECSRCIFGAKITLNPKIKEGDLNHRALIKRGYIAIILVSK